MRAKDGITDFSKVQPILFVMNDGIYWTVGKRFTSSECWKKLKTRKNNVVQHFHGGIVFDSEILAWRNELETLATNAYLQYSSRIDYLDIGKASGAPRERENCEVAPIAPSSVNVNAW